MYHLSGANGSGKTTLLQMLAGVLAEHDTELLKSDHSPLNKHEIFYHAHRTGLRPQWTGWDNLSDWAALNKFKVKHHIKKIIEYIDIYKLNNNMDVPIAQLSAGQQQRQSLLRLALVEDRPLWLLDEPETNLDTQAIEALGQIVAQHSQRGGTIIWASHQNLPIPVTERIAL